MELIEHLEAESAIFVAILRLVLENLSALCVVVGLYKTGQLAIKLRNHHSHRSALVLLRLRFCVWLAIALEFQLGADIVATTIAPSFESLGKLGAIAAIRTFLNHFLNKELAGEVELQYKTRKHTH